MKSATKTDFPRYKNPESGTEYTCIGWACGMPKCNWEWYAFEEVDKENGIYFGLVHGFETEFGDFSAEELKENGIKLITNASELQEIMPPIGWERA